MNETLHAITFEDAQRFFLEPRHTRQRQYEALRAYFAEGLTSVQAAQRFNYQPGSFRLLCWRFRHEMDRDFFRGIPHGPKSQPIKSVVHDRVVDLRKRNFSIYDIRDELERSGPRRLSATAIQEILREEGFQRLPRRGGTTSAPSAPVQRRTP